MRKLINIVRTRAVGGVGGLVEGRVVEISSVAGGGGFDSAGRRPKCCRRNTKEPEEPLAIWGCSIVALGWGEGMRAAERRIIGCGRRNS